MISSAGSGIVFGTEAAAVQLAAVLTVQWAVAAFILLLGPSADRLEGLVGGSMFFLEGLGSLLLLLSQQGGQQTVGTREGGTVSGRRHLEPDLDLEPPRAEQTAEPDEQRQQDGFVNALLAQQAAFAACLLSMLLLPFMRLVIYISCTCIHGLLSMLLLPFMRLLVRR